MNSRIWRITAFIFFLGLAQAAAAAFCPLGSVKKSKRPPVQRPVAPVMAWVPAQPVRQRVINGQAMVLVPVYPAIPTPAYYGYPR